VEDVDEALEFARGIGFPVIIKAAAGGGGKGMRVARQADDFARSFQLARSEALSAFGNGDVYVEKYLARPRHIEFQILGDTYGNVIHLGERDCSVQRRHQKLIEESPAVGLDPTAWPRIAAGAVAFAEAIGYESAGTAEFLVDGPDVYFLELNGRIQVEHPVTEEVTGLDLVTWQIRIAAGEQLQLDQRDLEPVGHAIECRINAEDPARDFAPSAGVITEYLAPGGPGIRMDSHLYQGYAVPPNYDSLLAKLIAWGPTREVAIARMERALSETVITGVPTTISFHRQALADEAFRRGDVHTGFVGDFLDRRAGALGTEEHEISPVRA